VANHWPKTASIPNRLDFGGRREQSLLLPDCYEEIKSEKELEKAPNPSCPGLL
jgi:hypothetical protein